MNVLIAEDDPASRHILQRIIGSLGHRVAAAANGREAWEQLQAGEFSFVITDWMMPEWDGLELCRRIRSCARPDYVYIIIQTSRSGQEDLLTGMDAGADDFIVKPVDRRELQVRMRAAERLLRLQRELRDKNDQLELINARLRRLSRLDPLTGLGNRLAFEERITEFHHRALRYGSGYAIILCDADHFKAYNDTEGHLAGDEVLRRISAALTGCLRSSDGAFRYGGEEIVILLPEQGLTEARRIAERLRSAVESLAIVRRDGSGRAVTISCGVAAFSADSQAGDWEAVIEQADQALYRAKAMGRNRVEAFPLSAPAPEAIPAQVDV